MSAFEGQAPVTLEPGYRACLLVEIIDYPHGDLTNVRVAMRGFSQSFWVPTALLRALAPHEAQVLSH